MFVCDLILLHRLRNNRFIVFQNVTGGGIRGQCPSVAANKRENSTSVYIFPMLAKYIFNSTEKKNKIKNYFPSSY